MTDGPVWWAGRNNISHISFKALSMYPHSFCLTDFSLFPYPYDFSKAILVITSSESVEVMGGGGGLHPGGKIPCEEVLLFFRCLVLTVLMEFSVKTVMI